MTIGRRELVSGLIVTPLALHVPRPRSVRCEFKHRGTTVVLHCHYYENLTDAENIAEWTQGWGVGKYERDITPRVTLSYEKEGS